MGYQQITLVGNIGKDPEKRELDGGKVVTSFPLAVNRSFTTASGEKKEVVVWFRVSTWAGLAEVVAKYKRVGDEVMVVGRLEGDEKGNPRTFTGDSGTFASFDVTAQEVVFVGGKREG